MSLLAEMQRRIGPVLQRRSAQVAPAPDAWQRLEATLAKEAQPLPSQHILPHLAPGAGHFFTQLFAGGVTMSKRFILTAGVLTLVIAMVVVSIFNNVTPVSAQVVLDKAYAAQASAARPAQGIEHIRSEMYNNYSALPEDQGTNTTMESYHDIESGNSRTVVMDSQTGKVLDAFAYDGTYTYSTGARDVSPLTVYRSPQANVADLKPRNTNIDTNAGAKSMFDQLRQDPNVQLVGQETWDDGRTVYVLRSQQQQIKVIVKDGVERPTGEILTYFDTTTYEIAGYRTTMQKDGKELRINSYKLLVNEILPKGTPVAWDLSDLQGKIAIVDDPDRQNGDLLPEIVSEKDLAAKTKTGYLLKTVPAGYSLEISAPPKQSANEPFIYIASYRTPANDYFVIQATDAPNVDSDETYTTASGLKLHFMRDITDPSGKHFITAQVEAPEGVAFTISSTLPRETVKAWSEMLVIVK
jgi:hypothetical protein